MFAPIVDLGRCLPVHGSKVLPSDLHSTHNSSNIKFFYGIILQATYENPSTYWQDDNIILFVGLACERRSSEQCFLFIIQKIINHETTWLNQVCLYCTAGRWSGSPWAQIRRVWVIASSQPIVLVGCSHKQTHLHARLLQPPWRISFPTAHKTHHKNASGPLLCLSFRWPEVHCLV